MRVRKFAGVAIFAAVLLSVGYSVGQQDTPNDEEVAQYRAERNAALRLGGYENGVAWAKAQSKAVGNRKLLDSIALDAFTRIGNTSTTNDLLVLQTMQNQRIIEQNDRIITLLEESNKKK